MEFRGKLSELSFDREGNNRITLTSFSDCRKEYDDLSDKEVDVIIKPHRKKRSLDANGFCWAMCTDIGNALMPPLTKEEVYRKAIRDVGEYEPLPIREDAVETFKRRWETKGIGWFVDIVDDSKLPGYKLVFAYYGSSTYDTKSMSRLIDYLVQDAVSMNLPIPASKEQEEMLRRWSRKSDVEEHHAE